MLLPLLLACTAPASAPGSPPTRPPAARAEAPQPGPILRGLCDASTATARSDGRFLVGDDEHNRLFVFEPDGTPGVPLELPFRDGELDLEGSARAPDGGIWWVASHDRGKGTTPKPARQHLFRTDDQGTVQVDVTDLWDRLLQHAELRPLLEATNGQTSKDMAGFSIEALHAEGDALWLGLRAPIVDGKALLIELIAPEQPAVGTVHRVDLGGLGFRALEPHAGRLYAIAGPADDEGVPRLVTVDLGTGQTAETSLDISTVRPEGLVSLPDGLLVLSDDGKHILDGTRCKKRPAAERQARTLWIRPPT